MKQKVIASNESESGEKLVGDEFQIMIDAIMGYKLTILYPNNYSPNYHITSTISIPIIKQR